MPIRVADIIDEILPRFDKPEGIESFYKTSGDTVYVENYSDTVTNRKGFSNQSDFDNKELFITKFGDIKGDNIQTMLFAKELSLVNENGVTSNTITNNTGDYIKIEEGQTFNYEIIKYISDKSKLPILIDLAVQKARLKELIEAVVEIDNNLEAQYKLLPKIVAERDQLINDDLTRDINYKQLIIYGPAGVGKTYGIKNIAKDKQLNISEENFEKQTVHTVFHPEYSYYDFFGKVMPIKDKNNQISYDFLPGPFAQALSKAYKNITKQPINPEKVILVVDELNRGNAASIFGGLFNLLDRNDIGISEYPLNIYGMEAMWLKEQIGDSHLSTLETYSKKTNFEMYDKENKSLKIYIPDNLSIICTMNTSDQTIFSLDKAFQRRFNKSFITAQNSIDNYPIKSENNDIEIKYKDKEEGISWRNFLLNLNEFIVKNAEVEDVDNATIGAFFVKPKGGFILEEDIKYTIMYYLWYDLFNGWKRETLKKKLNVDVKSFEQFVSNYQNFIDFFKQTQTDTTNQE